MAARRKRIKSKTKRISFKLGKSKRRKQRKVTHRLSLMSFLKVLAVVCVLAGVVVGLVFLDKYVKKNVPVSEKIGSLVLVDVPAWINEPLKDKIYTAARAKDEDLRLDEDAARSVQNNLEREVVWLQEVRVQTSYDCLLIRAKWRKPLALVKLGLHKFYVDAELVVLDFVPMTKLPIVRIDGLSAAPKAPPPGEVCRRDDLAAAIDILAALNKRDESVAADKPLLYEIDSIDVSNFNGRQNSRASHIILYAKDNTEIIWGAEFGTWQQYLEATDEQKIAKLYGYYKEYGSFVDVKYINLRDPQDNVPLPVDKY